MASTYLTRTTGTPTNAKKWTISFWVKISGKRADAEDVVYVGTDASNEVLLHRYETDGTLSSKEDTSAVNTIWRYGNNNRVFRDTHAWQHWVYAFDSTLGTANDRLKVYVNGVERRTIETLTNDVTVPLNHEAIINKSGYIFTFGRRTYNTDNYFTGLLSHVHFIDGIQYDASTFGETDSATGEWKIKTNPTISDYGNNGFFILKDGNSVTDQSGKGNNFTANGTLTKTEDCPSNVFCNFNSNGPATDVTLANGNNNATYGTSSSRTMLYGSLGAASGKYYWECEIQGSSSANNAVLGVTTEIDYSTQVPGITNYAWGFRGYDGAVYNNNSSVGGTWATFTNGDIIGVAINLDDEQGGLNKLYFAKNGTWLNGADPSNHSSTTGVVGITRPEDGVSGFIFPVFGDAGTSATPKFKMNWGNGYFGSSAVASAGTNASNNGIFEYDVPTGFTALSTKGLNL